jgi:eukaryotic-like serine/threonine-protein kinase
MMRDTHRMHAPSGPLFFTTGNTMNEPIETTTPIEKLALDRKLLTKKQLDQCFELVKKSKKIGLETTVEEILVRQGVLTEQQVHELREISQLTEDGTVFGPYRLGRQIGAGGMGKVYEAVHEFMGRTVAVKVINQSLTSDKTNASRFFQEIRALAKLCHPNIVTIYDAGRVNRRHYFAMELLPGPSLKEYVDSKKRLEEKEALAIVRAAALALAHAHAKNVIHRDVKPENIMFDSNGDPKITDFGLVMHHDADHLTLTQEGHLVGSFYYTSPEQIDGNRDIDGRSDIYSLGATLYYLLTGRTVYAASSPQELMTKHLTGTIISPRKYNPVVSRHTEKLIRKMMAIKREKRFQTMDAVAVAIERPSLIMRIKRFAVPAGIAVVMLGLGIILERVFGILDKLP